MELKKRLAEAFNTLYKPFVNENINPDINALEYVDAYQFVETYYPKINNGVLEYLAAYMIFHPEGKIEFVPSKKDFVDLVCTFKNTTKVIGYNESGAIVKDIESTVKQIGE